MKTTRPRTVCVIQQVAAEPPSAIAGVLRGEGWQPSVVCVHRGESVPWRLGAHRGLVIMGGPMSVYDGRQHPFLDAERRLIDEALARNRPVLGICLGSQLLASALGAAVHPNTRKEIGWHDVSFTRPAVEDPLWRGLTEDLTAFHWHGDVFELPQGAVSLAWSRLTDCQAFRWGETAYGVLFHIEMDERGIARMTRAFQDDLFATGQRPAEVVGAAPRHLPALRRVGEEFLRRWTGLLED